VEQSSILRQQWNPNTVTVRKSPENHPITI
jgi:hypothetical protein